MGAESNTLKSNQRDTARVEAFSDGVFAISITLLVLEVKVPIADATHPLSDLLTKQWSAYLTYIVSFLVIGIIWSNHHNLFNAIKRVDQGLIILNLIFLMVIAFIPFPTALLGEYIQDPANKHLVTIIYSATLMLGGLIFFFLRWYTYGNNRLVDKSITPARARQLILRSLIAPIFYLFSLLISLLSVELSLALYVLIVLFYALPDTLFHSMQERKANDILSSSER